MPKASQMTLEALRSVPLFASLSDEAATELRDLLLEKDVPTNTRLFNKGETGDAMYLIETGRVRISIKDDDNKEITLTEIAQGDFFG
jgi:CRP/FNR family cyclic AMP-dependent transcriptional regulator